MRVVIAGSRSITDYSAVCQAIADSGFEITEVISGCANGVDSMGERWALEHDIRIARLPAEWRIYGRRAGMVRNRWMGEIGEALVAIWDNKSRGTADMIYVMERLRKPVFVRIHCPTTIQTN